MPLPVRRKSRRLSPCRRAASSLRSSAQDSYCFCSRVCGGGMNSSFEAIREGIGSGDSSSASSSHWRFHISALLLFPNYIHPAVLHLVPGLQAPADFFFGVGIPRVVG